MLAKIFDNWKYIKIERSVNLHIEICQQNWKEDGNHEKEQENLNVRDFMRMYCTKAKKINDDICCSEGNWGYFEESPELINLPVSCIHFFKLFEDHQLIIENVKGHKDFKRDIHQQ